MTEVLESDLRPGSMGQVSPVASRYLSPAGVNQRGRQCLTGLLEAYVL